MASFIDCHTACNFFWNTKKSQCFEIKLTGAGFEPAILILLCFLGQRGIPLGTGQDSPLDGPPPTPVT